MGVAEDLRLDDEGALETASDGPEGVGELADDCISDKDLEGTWNCV